MFTVLRGAIVNRTKYWCRVGAFSKNGKYIGFCVYRRSYLLWSPVIGAFRGKAPLVLLNWKKLQSESWFCLYSLWKRQTKLPFKKLRKNEKKGSDCLQVFFSRRIPELNFFRAPGRQSTLLGWFKGGSTTWKFDRPRNQLSREIWKIE